MSHTMRHVLLYVLEWNSQKNLVFQVFILELITIILTE